MSDVFQINLTVADGQVATTATEITKGRGNHARPLDLTFANVGGQEETLILSISRGGGTARRLKRVVLSPDEQLEICALALNSTDSLLAQTSNAASVDFVVAIASGHAPYAMHVFDDKGGLKSAPYILEQIESLTGAP